MENRDWMTVHTDVYGHIIDEDRRKNAELFENAFYRGKSSDSEESASAGGNNIQIPEGWIRK